MEPESAPSISKALLEYLEGRFPSHPPKQTETHSDMLWRGGQCSVVQHLRAVFDGQNAVTLNPNV